MISKRKKYIAKMLLKKCNIQNIVKSHLDFTIKLMEETYEISNKFLEELRKEYTVDNYIERLIPILDHQFSIEDMQEAIKFYSSELGRKMLDPVFLNEINKICSKMDSEITQKFAVADGRF